MARAPLTFSEKSHLTRIVDALTNTESQFCCGGIITVPSEQTLNLFYKQGSPKQAHTIELPATEPADIQKLLEACSPASHGHGTETVYDPSYRLARELKQGEFAFTRDLVYQSDILHNITALTSSRDSSGKLIADLYKLNSYSTGGFFKSHRDTPKSDRHIGTLVVALPIPFEGGALRVSHEGKDVLFDWRVGGENAANVTLPWAFLFSDVEHEVLPVTSGTRVTLAYDIFVSSEVPSSTKPTIDGKTLPLYSDFLEVLKDPRFLPQGGKLGLALSHAYPVNVAKDSAFFASHLKGRDAALYRALLALQTPVELRAVYAPEDAVYYEGYNDAPENFTADGFEPVGTSVNGYPTLLYTSRNFGVLPSMRDDQWEEGETKLLRKKYNVSLEPEIIWVCKPGGSTFSDSGSYLRYGNEASLATVYAAAAFVVEVPAAGKGPRLGTAA